MTLVYIRLLKFLYSFVERNRVSEMLDGKSFILMTKCATMVIRIETISLSNAAGGPHGYNFNLRFVIVRHESRTDLPNHIMLSSTCFPSPKGQC